MRGLKDRSIYNLFDRLDRLELGKNNPSANDASLGHGGGGGGVPYTSAEELEQMTDKERFEAWFNYHVREVMPAYKAVVMRFHNITSDEYDRRTLEGDQSIYLPQSNNKFEHTDYMERVAHVLGLNYQELQNKFDRGELKHLIAAGPNNVETGGWCDEDPNRVFWEFFLGIVSVTS